MSNPLANFAFAASVPQSVQRRFAGMTQIYSPVQVDFAIDQLSVRLTAQLQNTDPVLLTVMQGGVHFCGLLQHRLAFPLRTGYVHVSRYGDATSGGELAWHGQAIPDLDNATVVFVDDILDQGRTLAELNTWAVRQGAREVIHVVLVQRESEQRILSADFFGLSAGPGFLVGCGMDYLGYGRNFAGIYRIADEPG